MAEYNEGTSFLGRQEILKQKVIADVVYFRLLNIPAAPKRRMGTLNLCVDFGEGGGALFYLAEERTLWNQSVVWYPPYESRLGVNWTIYVDWVMPGVQWNMNSF
jgi:hypothetical protein